MRISVRLVTRLACRVIARVLVPYAKKKPSLHLKHSVYLVTAVEVG